MRYIYGVMERQFRNYFKQADRSQGPTGERLLQILERRLDNLVYRMGFARSRPQARQMVVHGHVALNGRKVTVPSYLVRAGDEIAIREGSRGLESVQAALADSPVVPPYLEVDVDVLKGRLEYIPPREEIPTAVDEHMIVEFYSR